MLPCGEVTVVVSVSLYVVTITRHSVAMWGGYLLLCLLYVVTITRHSVVVGYVVTITRHRFTCWSVCIIVCCNYYQTQCCHVGRLLVVVSVSLYVVTITRHSVAMWGGYLLLCLYHCMLQLLPDTVLPCGEVACCCVCIIVCCNYYQTQCCHVGRLLVVVSVSLYVVTITRHSVAMWGGCLLLCLYHCML